jgi:hypothetical protein
MKTGKVAAPGFNACIKGCGQFAPIIDQAQPAPPYTLIVKKGFGDQTAGNFQGIIIFAPKPLPKYRDNSIPRLHGGIPNRKEGI